MYAVQGVCNVVQYTLTYTFDLERCVTGQRFQRRARYRAMRRAAATDS